MKYIGGLLILGFLGCAQFNQPTVDGLRSGQARIFITSVSTDSGGLGLNAAAAPLTTADAMCSTAASSAGLRLTYKAILSLTTTTAISRFSSSIGNVYVFDNAKESRLVANSFSDLFLGTSTTLLSAIDRDENYATKTGQVWTGTTSAGAAGANCTDWTVGGIVGPKAIAGDIGSLTSNWITRVGTVGCNQTLPVYCVGVR